MPWKAVLRLRGGQSLGKRSSEGSRWKLRSLQRCLMIENVSPLYLGCNYRGRKGIYFLAINGRPRRKLSHQRCSKFQLVVSIMFMFSLPLSGTARGHSACPALLLLAPGPRRSRDKATQVGELGVSQEAQSSQRMKCLIAKVFIAKGFMQPSVKLGAFRAVPNRPRCACPPPPCRGVEVAPCALGWEEAAGGRDLLPCPAWQWPGVPWGLRAAQGSLNSEERERKTQRAASGFQTRNFFLAFLPQTSQPVQHSESSRDKSIYQLEEAQTDKHLALN